jgi:hypothetical protein
MFGIVTTGLLACMLSEQEFGAYFLALSIVSLGAVVGSLGLPNTVVGKEDFPKFAPQYCSLAPDSAAGHVLVGDESQRCLTVVGQAPYAPHEPAPLGRRVARVLHGEALG